MDADLSHRPLVLVVDDQPSNIDTLVAMLEDAYDLAAATSGADALALLTRSRRPDLILLDVMMPDMDGYVVCEALKAAPATRDIPVIFVTARDDARSESRALAVGGIDFIHKPVNPDVLRARTRMHLELSRHRFRLESLVHARTVALAQARDEAEGTTRALRTLMANLSHELRTPLNQIMGFNYLLSESVADPQARDMLAQVRHSSEQLLRLLGNLIDLTRFEAGSIRVEAVGFDLPQLLHRAAADIAERHPEQPVSVSLTLDPALPHRVHGDPVRVAQVLAALLDNAVKFSNGQPVALGAAVMATAPDSATVRIEVRDRGPGLSETARAALFAPFRQGDASSTRAHGGLGLGLTIAQRLVALMGGTLALEGSDGGTVARVELRLMVDADAARQAATPGPTIAPKEAAHTLARLRELLDDGDCEARTLWQAAGPALGNALGDIGPQLGQALEAFDFESALRMVEEATAARPEFAAGPGATRPKDA